MTIVWVVLIVLGLGIGIGVGLANRRRGGKRKTSRYTPARWDQEPFRYTHPDFDPKTGAWKTWDGTPYGAIDTLLEDADGDVGSSDFDGDGLPG
jgi:hypothetical protein